MDDMRKVLGYDGRYMVDRQGNVWSMYRFANRFKRRINKIQKLKPIIKKNGYKTVTLFDDNGKSKKHQVHRLVAMAFLDNPENKRCVCHKDNNPLNCCVDNLYWGTDSENIQQAYDDGIHPGRVAVAQINKNDEIVRIYESQSEASRVNHIPSSCISQCVSGKIRKRAKGYKWVRVSRAEYEDWKRQEG